MDPYATFKLVYKWLMILVTCGFVIGAVAAWWVATPANQLLLVSGILAVLALITGLSISKYDRRDRRFEALGDVRDDIRESLRSLEIAPHGISKVMFGNGGISVNYAEPEVHKVDMAQLAEAKQMAADGKPIDDICRAIDPAHDRNDPVHQEAFRKLVQAMIDQG